MIKFLSKQDADIQNAWDFSADHYAAYASQKKLYRESADALVRCADIKPGMVVVDLACGTGIVTETILKYPGGAESRIISVDYSTEMLAYAQKRIKATNVEFHQSKAEKLSKVVKVKADRVLCNAAFWHFDKAKALNEIARILKPDGKCLLGLPVQDFKVVDFLKLYDENRVIWMIMEEKLLRGYAGAKPVENKLVNKEKEDFAKDKNDVLGYLAGQSLGLERREMIKIDLSPKDYIDFLRIPIMAKKSFLFKDMSYEAVSEILDVVDNELEWVEASAPPSSWLIYILNKIRA